MASAPVKAPERLRNKPESYNGWNVYYTEREGVVEDSPNQAGIRRRRRRGAAFEPQQFWDYVNQPSLTACWLWQGRTLRRNGYGAVWYPPLKITTGAHRVAWILTKGAIPPDLHVLHNCPGGDEPRCCNPAHLWLGTQLDNMQDMAAKGRRSPHAHSPKGRPWSPDQRAHMLIARRARADRQIAAREAERFAAVRLRRGFAALHQPVNKAIDGGRG